MRKGETALDTLQILARDLVAHNMTLLAVVQLLSSASLVDTNHGHTNRPGCLSDTQTKVSVVGVHVSSLLESLDDFNDGLQDVVVEFSLLKLAKQLQKVSLKIQAPIRQADIPASYSHESVPWH